MSYRLCHAGADLRAEFDALAPGRDRTSDGWIGDASHAARRSDHNPDRRFDPAIVKAIDVDKGLGPGLDFDARVEEVRAKGAAGDRRLVGGYIIWRGRICGTHTKWAWHTYRGKNGHFEHAHFSFADEERGFDQLGDWLSAPAAPGHQHREATIWRKDIGHPAEVRDLQGHLNAWRRSRKLSVHPVDGVWDEWLEVAFRTFQRTYGLVEDGICGPESWRMVHKVTKGATA